MEHDGYQPAQMPDKRGRNRRLLQLALAEQPDDAYLHYQLGKDHEVHASSPGRALYYAQAGPAATTRAVAPRPGGAPPVHTEEARPLRAGAALAQAQLPHWRQSPDFFFTLGDLLLDWAAAEPQRAAELLPMIESSWRQAVEIGEQPELQDRCAAAAASSRRTTWRCCTTAWATARRRSTGVSGRLRSAAPPPARGRDAAATPAGRLEWRGAGAAFPRHRPRRRRLRCSRVPLRAATARAPAPDCAMALALPDSRPARAHRLQAHARAHRPLAERARAMQSASSGRAPRSAFEQATALHADPAYGAGGGARADQGRPGRPRRCERARGIRQADPPLPLAYTLESHALLGLGRAGDALECLQRAAGAMAARPRPSRLAGRRAAALPAATTRRSGRSSQALALKMDDAVPHFRLGMSFKDLGMKAEAAECVRTAVAARPRQQRRGGARAARLPGARSLPLARSRRRAARAARGRARTAAPTPPVETGAFPHAVLVDDPLEQLKVARHYALHVRAQGAAAAAPRWRAPTAGGCASATCRPTSTTMRPAS